MPYVSGPDILPGRVGWVDRCAAESIGLAFPLIRLSPRMRLSLIMIYMRICQLCTIKSQQYMNLRGKPSVIEGQLKIVNCVTH